MKPSNTSERLSFLMKEYNLKQVDILNKCAPFCKKFNVKLGRNDLSQYVSGKVEPGQYKLSILGMALDVSEAWLMGFDVPMERSESQTNNKDDISTSQNDNISDTKKIHQKKEMPSLKLNETEECLIKMFRTLNKQGQEYILQTIDMAIGNEKYIKTDNSSVVEKLS